MTRDALSSDPLVLLIRSQVGMAERLLAEHVDDGSGRCCLCSGGQLTGLRREHRQRQAAAVHLQGRGPREFCRQATRRAASLRAVGCSAACWAR